MKEPPFAGLVRERMKEQGLGLRALCRRADVDPSFLSKVLMGKRSPPWEEALLRRLAAVLRVDAARLIVCAGRIPSEWSRLWSDRELFHSVHRLAASQQPPEAAFPRRTGRAIARPVPAGRKYSLPAGMARSAASSAKASSGSALEPGASTREILKKPKEADSREFGEELL